MAEVSLDTLEASNALPVPTVAGTQVAGYRRFTVVEGPMKIEYNIYQQAAGNDFAASDTFVTGLVTPVAVEVQVFGVDLSGTTLSESVTLEADPSQSTYRTVTIHDCDGSNGNGVIVKVIGF